MNFEDKKTVLEVRNLVAKYGDKTVLHNVNANIKESEIRVVLGTSGCGKTTFLKNTIGLLTPYSGTVKLFGQEIGELDSPETKAILRKIGITFQYGALLGSISAGENVALPLRMLTDLSEDIIRDIVELKLKQVDLHNSYDLYPQELSGGMKKRVAMARALALDPPLLFCDEPGAGLDPVTSNGIDDLLLRIRDELGITIIVITHELLSIKKISDNIIFLDKGYVLYDGPLEEALKAGEGPLYNFFNREKSGV